MIRTLSIALGGAAGAVLRYWLSTAVYQFAGRGFPNGTLVVNALGSFLMGLVYVLLMERMALGVEWRAALLIGLLGSFTTFAAFSIETVNLIEAGEQMKALANILISVEFGIAGCWLGIVAGRQI